jgi:homoserine dehydrogenase
MNKLSEADPSLDLEGWDSAAKLSILIQALMGARVKPKEIEKHAISEEISEERIGNKKCPLMPSSRHPLPIM